MDWKNTGPFQAEEQPGIPFLNQKYWHQQTLLLNKEFGLPLHSIDGNENFHASHAEMHLMSFLYLEKLGYHLNLGNLQCQNRYLTPDVRDRLKNCVATVYVTILPCSICQSFQKLLNNKGMNIKLVPMIKVS